MLRYLRHFIRLGFLRIYEKYFRSNHRSLIFEALICEFAIMASEKKNAQMKNFYVIDLVAAVVQSYKGADTKKVFNSAVNR